MPHLRDTATAWLHSDTATVLIEVTEARGSVPRERGTRMLVAATQTAGTIGGGHLELKAIQTARDMLAANDDTPRSEHYPLGPALGQCCGGAVTLGFEALNAAALARWPAPAPMFHLQLYGAGHVGRAIARTLAPLDVVVDWIDERDEEFPARFFDNAPGWPTHIRKVCVDAVEAEVRDAQSIPWIPLIDSDSGSPEKPDGSFWQYANPQLGNDRRADAVAQRYG